VTLIAGSVDYGTRDGRLRAFNSAFVVGPGGTLDASYDKVHLVPFGEYVPLQRLLFFVDAMVQGAIAGFAPGDRLEPLPTPLGPVATFVCYEAIFPELVRALARPAAFMVNITNDAGSGRAPRRPSISRWRSSAPRRTDAGCCAPPTPESARSSIRPDGCARRPI
jgi:apolipoprotein N-acyltransferase